MKPTYSSVVIEWNPENGSGYLVNGEDVFPVRISNFVRFPRLPKKGDRVLHNVSRGDELQPVVSDARLLRAGGAFHGLMMAWPCVMFVLPIVAFLVAPIPGSFWHMVSWVFVLSTATYLLCHCAEFLQEGIAGKLRADSTLHFLEVLGGWPGVILAQLQQGAVMSRRYQFFFWISVGIWQVLALEAIFEWSISQEVLGGLTPLLDTVLVFA